MNRFLAKISLFFLFLSLLISCNAVKRVESDQALLTENEVFLDGEKINDNQVYNQLYQEPNTRLLGVPIRLHFYNLARPDIDSILTRKYLDNPKKKKFLVDVLSYKQFEKFLHSRKNFNEWIKNTGEAPVIVSKEETEKSVRRLNSWYWNHGWFNVETDHKIIPSENEKKRASVEYYVQTHTPYIVDSISKRIASVVIYSLYDANARSSHIKEGVQYKTLDYNDERDRLTRLFRNSGVYNFDQEFISFEADTVGTNYKVNTAVIIKNRPASEGDTTATLPFKIHDVTKVNVFTDYAYANRLKPVTDSVQHKGYNIYSFEKQRYKPEAITDAIFLRPENTFSDIAITRTYKRTN